MNRADRCDDHSPRVCPKTGKPLTVRQVSAWAGWLFPLAGIISLSWFLARVLPRPAGAAHQFQYVAAPLATGFVLWLLGMSGCALAFRHARQKMLHARFTLAGVLFVLGLGAGLLAVAGGPGGIAHAISNENTGIPLYTPLLPMDAPNSPVGTGLGIHPGRVAWVNDPLATNGEVTWDDSNGFYWDDNHCNQSEVDTMVPTAMRYLTGAQSATAAWDAVFHDYNQKHSKGDIGYQPGEKIAILLDLSSSCDFTNSQICRQSAGGKRLRPELCDDPQCDGPDEHVHVRDK